MQVSSQTQSETPAGGRGVRFSDRVLILGRSGDGKSSLINHIAAGASCQVLIYDTKDELVVPGATPVEDPARIDWNARIIHFVDDSCELKTTGRLFDLCWKRKAAREEIGPGGKLPRGYGLVVVVHEAGDLCLDQPNQTPRSVINYLKKGRQRGLGLIAGSQRPVNIPPSARTEIQHVATFAGGLDKRDIAEIAGLYELTPQELNATLSDLHGRYGRHAFLWRDLTTRTTTAWPPLPEHLRARSIATIIEQEHPDG